MSIKRTATAMGIALMLVVAGTGVAAAATSGQVVGGIGYATGNLNGAEAVGVTASGAAGGATGGAIVGGTAVPALGAARVLQSVVPPAEQPAPEIGHQGFSNSILFLG